MNAIEALIAEEKLPSDYSGIVEAYWQPLADRIATETKRPLVVGINGAQGSGKSTLCLFLEQLLAERGLNAVTISLDDLYLTRSERAALAAETHRLFVTRGVPGTHDVAHGEAILHDLAAGSDTFLPAFDKATDDRDSLSRGPVRKVDVLLFEGWCVGAVPQPAEALREPVNRLEAEEDPDGEWRREVNRRLATDYAELFAQIDLLVMLKVEDFSAVRANRALQEQKLAARNPIGTAIMDGPALDRFLMHYERLTRWMLQEMPARADVLIEIGADQRPK